MTSENAAQPDVQVLIVGAGFAGLYQLHRMRQMGISARIVEKGSDVGGTWYWNRYPGARCDVMSIYYSVSYLPDLDQEWTWPEAFASQGDILLYMQHIAHRLDLYRNISFNTFVTAATWDSIRELWVTKTETGAIITSRYLIMATGTLTVARTPEVSGLQTFNGRWFHTGRWPHEKVDFTGRRVAVIGTGSTGIQVIPRVAEEAAELTVFQRTPKFSVPAANRPLTTSEIASVKSDYPELRKAGRKADFGFPVTTPDFLLTDVPEAERDSMLESMWQSGRFGGFLVSYKDHLGLKNPEVNEILAEFARKKIREVVKDPQMAETLTPRGYPIGVNRLCRDTDYYETFNRANVRLVDTRVDPILEITADGLQTKNGERNFDDIIFATGYDAMTGALTAIDVVGRKQSTIRDEWKDGARTYLGMAISGYPNLFVITGPGGPSVLSNAIVTGEQNVDFISELISHMRERNYATVEASTGAERDWMKHVDEVAQQSLYRDAHKANAWYTGKNVPGKKVAFLPYAGGVGTYEKICADVIREGFRGFEFS